MGKRKLAKIIYKKLKEGIPGGPQKNQKVKDHAVYDGKRYELNELVKVDFAGKERPGGLVPREIEEARISNTGITSLPKPTKRKPSDKKIEAIKKYDALSDDELRYLTEEQSIKMGVNPKMYLAPYRQKRLGVGDSYGVKTKFTDEMGRPVYMTKYSDAVEELTAENTKIVKDTMSAINRSSNMPINAQGSLMRHLGRMLSQSKAQKKVSQDQVIQKFSELDAPFIANLLSSRGKLNKQQIAKAKELGIFNEGEQLEISHIVPAADDPMKSFDKDNLYLSMKKQNRDVTRQQMPEENFMENYGSMFDDRLKNYYGYSKGGVIKNILGTATDMSRRSFLKGSGALALSASLPMRTVAKMLPKVAEQAATRMAPPWIKSMVGIFDKLNKTGSSMSHTLKNGTKIQTIGKKGNKQGFQVVNSDGHKVPVNMMKEKDGSLHIEFDIRDNFNNNQHIYMDNKTGRVEIVDENFYMTGPEDYAKDDPLIWDVTTPSQMQAYEKKMGVMKGDVDDYMLDYGSTPAESDYSDLFESFVDSFSPSGNIFRTKQKAEILKNEKIQKQTYKKAQEQTHKKEQAQKQLEDDEMRFEQQFRGGNMHSFKRGGSTIRPKPKPENPTRFNFIKNLTDQEAMTRMMMAEDSSRQGGYGVAHVINNRANHSNYVNRYGSNSNQGISPIISVLSGKNQFTPYSDQNTRFFSDFKGQDLNLYDDYYKYAGQVLSGEIEDFTKGADFFALPSVNFKGNSFGLAQEPEYLNQHGAHNFYKSYNSGGIARRPEALPPLKGPDPLGISIRDMGERFIKKMSKGGILRKAPQVLGKLSDYRAKITGEVDQMYQTPKGPYTITNDHGAAVLDRTFDTLDETNVALKEMVKNFRTQDATTFRVFGQRPPKTPEGVSESAPEVDMGMVGKVIPPEEPGALFWNSREKIINAPSEAMQANQWLDFMKRGKHGILNPRGLPIIKDQELNDTSLAPYLSQMGKQIISKEKLVKEFDEMAPTFDVTVLGENNPGQLLRSVSNNLNQTDTQAIRDPKVKGFFDYMKDVISPLKEGDAKGRELIASKINTMIERNFGVKNALEEGVPQRFPFEIKEIIQNVSMALGKRGTGFEKYKRSTMHEGTQTLSGGDNYREFLFTNKPGKLRSGEPNYTYAHEFGLERGERAGGVVHTRVSDRTDQFGRRLMHIEEIQSDMHQQISTAQRKLKKQNAEFEKQGMTPQEAYAKMTKYEKEAYDRIVSNSKYAPRQDVKLKKEINANEQQMRLIQSKIEDLLAKPPTKATQIRVVRLNKERRKIRKILEEEKTKLAESTNTTGIPEGPLRKSEDYNEFVMKYLLRVAEEGGYDGLTISTPAIKNLRLTPGSQDFIGNLTAYGPIAKGAMKKAAIKSGAKLMKTAIRDKDNRGWEIPMILIKDNKVAKETIKRGMPIYKKGGQVKKVKNNG